MEQHSTPTVLPTYISKDPSLSRYIQCSTQIQNTMQTLVALFLGLACVVVSDVSAVIRRPGGLSATKPATPEIQELVDSVSFT